MKLIFLIAIISAMVVIHTEAAIAQGSGNIDTECPPACPGCETRDIGETWEGNASGSCFIVTCAKDQDSTNMAALGCASFIVGPDCIEVPGNSSAPYPDCCPHPLCS